MGRISLLLLLATSFVFTLPEYAQAVIHATQLNLESAAGNSVVQSTAYRKRRGKKRRYRKGRKVRSGRKYKKRSRKTVRKSSRRSSRKKRQRRKQATYKPVSLWQLPQLMDAAFADLLSQMFDSRYQQFADAEADIPEVALRQFFDRYEKEYENLNNKKFGGIIDFRSETPNTEPRFFVLNFTNGEVKKILVAHGKGSGRGNYVKRFSNRHNSHASSKGFYHTAQIYHGKHGASLALDGLDPTNDNARGRAVVIHGANYVRDGWVGRSWGCPAVKRSVSKNLIHLLRDPLAKWNPKLSITHHPKGSGSLLYIWDGSDQVPAEVAPDS